MKIVLATGIYPPALGGPATYLRELSRLLSGKAIHVTVITYADQSVKDEAAEVITVSRRGGPFLRWRRYAQALKKHAADADIVYAFSSVSCGVPLMMAGLRKPKKILRLGGDFFWER